MEVVRKTRTEIKYEEYFGPPCCSGFKTHERHFHIHHESVYLHVEDIDISTNSYGLVKNLVITHCPFCGQKFEFVNE